MRYKTPESILVVIYTSDLQILMLERADHADWWQSVTGSLEAGELPVQAAQREVQEETGIATDLFELEDWELTNRYEIFDCFRHRYAPDVTHNTEHVFGLRLPQKIEIRLEPQEHLDYLWLPAPQALSKCFSPSNQAAIQCLLNSSTL